MQIETYKQRILIPKEGKWLYNATADVVSDNVYLGKEADASKWVEITKEEKQIIEGEKLRKAASNYDDNDNNNNVI